MVILYTDNLFEIFQFFSYDFHVEADWDQSLVIKEQTTVEHERWFLHDLVNFLIIEFLK